MPDVQRQSFVHPALVERFGERTLWGSDWPHPNSRGIPDDGELVDLLEQIAPSEAARQALLVDNPQRLYCFPVALPVVDASRADLGAPA